MREIKFRFWTGKTMLDWLCVCQTAFNQFNVVHEYNQIKKDHEEKDKMTQAFDSMLSHGDLIRSGLMYKLFTSIDAVPMQFTGLKDKNGTEIYESDIVRFTSGKTFDDPKIGRIEYCGGGFAFKHPSMNFYIGTEREKRYEVIGNIYQNPELLKP